MAQIELKFKFNDESPYEAKELHRITRVSDMAGALFEIKFNLIRNVMREFEAKEGLDLDPIDVFADKLNAIFVEFEITDGLIS